MNDEDFLEALEHCTLAPDEFNHAGHVRAGYLYLKRHPFPEAAARTCAAIKAYAGSLGKPGKYHETLTIAFLALINARLREHGDGGGWEGFWRASAGGLTRAALNAYYPTPLLDSPAARTSFILPGPAYG